MVSRKLEVCFPAERWDEWGDALCSAVKAWGGTVLVVPATGRLTAEFATDEDAAKAKAKIDGLSCLLTVSYTKSAALYDVDLAGDFGLLAGKERHEEMSSDDLAEILRGIAEAVEGGEGILSPSSLTVRPLSDEPVEEPASIPASD